MACGTRVEGPESPYSGVCSGEDDPGNSTTCPEEFQSCMTAMISKLESCHWSQSLLMDNSFTVSTISPHFPVFCSLWLILGGLLGSLFGSLHQNSSLCSLEDRISIKSLCYGVRETFKRGYCKIVGCFIRWIGIWNWLASSWSLSTLFR